MSHLKIMPVTLTQGQTRILQGCYCEQDCILYGPLAARVPRGLTVRPVGTLGIIIIFLKQRFSLTDDSLEDILKMPASYMTPEYEKSEAENRRNISH